MRENEIAFGVVFAAILKQVLFFDTVGQETLAAG